MSTDWEALKTAVLEQSDIEGWCRQHFDPVVSQRDELAFLCPHHQETEPSCYINRTSGLFYCQGCAAKGNLIDLHMHLHSLSFKDALLELAREAQIEVDSPPSRERQKKSEPEAPPIDEGAVAGWHSRLRASTEKADAIVSLRRVSRKTLRRYQIGWDGDRYTIPIYDALGKIVNVRRYSPDKRSKMINYVAGDHRYGSPARLYGVHELAGRPDDPVIVTEGEWDKLVLSDLGYLAVTGTHGCKTWMPEWTTALAGRDVVICYDADPEGVKAVEQVVVPALADKVRRLRMLRLPFAEVSKQAKDVTDWVRAGFGDLQPLIDGAPEWTQPVATEQPEPEPESVSGDPDVDFEVAQMIIYETVPCHYQLTIEGQQLNLKVDDLMHAARFKRAFMQQLHRIPKVPGRKPVRDWDSHVNTWLRMAERKDMPSEASDEGALRESIQAALDDMPITEEPKDLDRGQLIMVGDQRAFKARALLHRLEDYQRLTLNELCAALRKMGCDSRSVRFHDQVLRTWVAPAKVEQVLPENTEVATVLDFPAGSSDTK